METPGYADIFATKGMEYIFVLGFIIVLVFFWRFLNRTGKAPHHGTADGNPSGLPFNRFKIPLNLYFHQGHSWVKPGNPDVAVIGVDDFLQNLIGPVNVVDLPRVGAFLKQGEEGWKLGGNFSTVHVPSPLTGEVLEINQKVLSDPQVINIDPYGAGWLLKLRAPKMKSDMASLLSGELASAWMKETTGNFSARDSER